MVRFSQRIKGSAGIEPSGGRRRADPHDDDVRIEFGAVAELDLLDLLGAQHLGDSDAAPHVDAFRLV